MINIKTEDNLLNFLDENEDMKDIFLSADLEGYNKKLLVLLMFRKLLGTKVSLFFKVSQDTIS